MTALNETKKWKHGTMVAYYHRDVNSKLLNKYQTNCPFVEIRFYNFTGLPNHVSQKLYECIWKPILIQNFLKETEKMMYIDSSIIFQQNANETLKVKVMSKHLLQFSGYL